MSDRRKILILSANPRGTVKLRLDEEVREIKEGLKRSKYRDQYLEALKAGEFFPVGAQGLRPKCNVVGNILPHYIRMGRTQKIKLFLPDIAIYLLVLPVR